ncbi:YggT family protein [Leuconostoc fallax]|nr:YggT family protein [Leuconostoc fallax]MBU7455636.1 YggT family protein [Leuconostoc fallax]MCO6183896.1 YggT family protein [Leuconostoc fallax]
MTLIFNLIFRAMMLYEYAIVVYILMTWLPGATRSRLHQWLGSIVMPYLSVFRFIPPIGMIDFSPVVAIIVLQFARSGLQYLVSAFI